MRKNLFIILIIFYNSVLTENISIIGCGYVGLTMIGILTKCKHKVIGFDINKNIISSLQENIINIYEPGLDELLFNNKNINFTTNINEVIGSKIIYICVPTPSNIDGSCDLSFLFKAFKNILDLCNNDEYKIICIKSTVPPGTLSQLQDLIIKNDKLNISLVYNPEFMREGSAINDVCTTNPIILGGEPETTQKILDLYKLFMSNQTKVIQTNFESAEIIKYAWNSFSAIRISYINELALLCKAFKANIFKVIQGFSLSEDLLPTNVIKPGPGWGGSCFPKDTLSFSHILEKQGFTNSIVHAAIDSNENHKKIIIKNILESFSDDFLGEKQVALLGLSFKANTNDIRNAPSIDIIKALLNNNIKINAYDPKANDNMKTIFPSINYYDNPYDAVKNVDSIVILTEWQEIKNLDLKKIASLCKKKFLLDFRNCFNPLELKKHGFNYSNMG